MKVLLDTNILLDVFLEREPFFEASSQIMGLAEQTRIDGWIGGTSVTTIFCLVAKVLSDNEARNIIKKLLQVFQVANINRLILDEALDNNFSDYEDSVLHRAALHANLDAIVTRNQQDFAKSQLPVYTPEEFLNVLDSLE